MLFQRLKKLEKLIEKYNLISISTIFRAAERGICSNGWILQIRTELTEQILKWKKKKKNESEYALNEYDILNKEWL